MGKEPDTILRDNCHWIEIGQAARFSRTKAVVIQAGIDDGKLRFHVEDDRRFITLAAAHRLKRETAVMLAAARANRAPRRVTTAERAGPHAAREEQDVLPMSSGRSGTGWLGTKPRT